MNKVEVLKKAAELVIEIDTFACSAINITARSYPHECLIRKFFTKYFEPNAPEDTAWFGKFTPKNQQERSLALLFAAELARYE